MTSEFAVLPDLVLARFMGNMEPLVTEMKLFETAAAKKKAAAGITVQPAASDK